MNTMEQIKETILHTVSVPMARSWAK